MCGPPQRPLPGRRLALKTQPFLPIPFAQFMIVRSEPGAGRNMTMPRPAAVADEHIGHQHVKRHVQQRESGQNTERQNRPVEAPGDAAQYRRERHHQEAESLRKVLLSPEIGIAASQTTQRPAVGLGIPRYDMSMTAGPTGVRSTLGRYFRLLRLLAGSALVDQFHAVIVPELQPVCCCVDAAAIGLPARHDSSHRASSPATPLVRFRPVGDVARLAALANNEGRFQGRPTETGPSASAVAVRDTAM